MNISVIHGSRAARGTDSSAYAGAPVTTGPAFARRLAVRRQAAGVTNRDDGGPVKTVPARSTSRPVPGEPGRARAGRSPGQPATMRSAGDRPGRLRTTCDTPARVLPAVALLTRATLPAMARISRALAREASNRKPGGRRRVDIRIEVDGLGEITVTLQQTSAGWDVAVHADSLATSLLLAGFAGLPGAGR